MDRNKKEGSDLYSLIKKELKIIHNLVEEMKGYRALDGIERLKGSILHDFYNACERIFKWIAKDINGDFNPLEQWHKELLFRMTVDIDGVRPKVISEELAAELNEFLQFRHLFRNIYGFELKTDLLGRLAEKFFTVAHRFIREINLFLKTYER